MSSYQFAANQPVHSIELEGLESSSEFGNPNRLSVVPEQAEIVSEATGGEYTTIGGNIVIPEIGIALKFYYGGSQYSARFKKDGGEFTGYGWDNDFLHDDWSVESTWWSYGGSPQEWMAQYGYYGMSQEYEEFLWERDYSPSFYSWVARTELKEKNREIFAKMYWFAQGMSSDSWRMDETYIRVPGKKTGVDTEPLINVVTLLTSCSPKEGRRVLLRSF